MTTPVWMIRPHAFARNPQTAVTNAFQAQDVEQDGVAASARAEFDGFVAALRGVGVPVAVTEDTPEPVTPDAVFPNNWVSFHDDGTVVLYPMLTPNRQHEVRPDAVAEMAAQHGFTITRTVDLRDQDGVLEGTGSLVLDRPQRIAYAALSPRTDRALAEAWCAELGYTLHAFPALDAGGRPIYHTNVMMSVDPRFAVVCTESVPEGPDRSRLLDALGQDGRVVVEISLDQMGSMAGNVLGLGDVIALSTQAHGAFTEAQRAVLAGVAPLVHAPLDTIETHGGGSARCMLAEVFLPRA